jgi:MoaA/NifB/PqqE/SkfB family radical SAM enzyme
MAEMVSAFKVAYHRERLESYLRNEPVFPVTLELNLTAKCNRKCPDCPSRLGSAHMSLSAGYVERLFAYLKGHTKGLIVTGGEPTLSPAFPDVLQMARRDNGFEDIVVVTNGDCLGDAKVSSALVSYASAVRVSLYDWTATSFTGLEGTLRRIEALRKRVDSSGSPLEIGVSALTSSANADVLGEVADLAYSAGAHWIYFHPTCTRDIAGGASRLVQKAVLDKIKTCQEQRREGFEVFVLRERYESVNVEFEGYHAAHFVLMIGADEKNYLATEVRYQPHYVIWDLTRGWSNDFLWQDLRLERIRSVTSNAYPAQGTMNRGVLYNTFIEKLKHGARKLTDETAGIPADGFHLPHVL